MYFNIKCIGKLQDRRTSSSDPWCSGQASSSDQSSTVCVFNWNQVCWFDSKIRLSLWVASVHSKAVVLLLFVLCLTVIAWDHLFVCLFDLILYIPSTIFQLYRDVSSWVEPVLS